MLPNMKGVSQLLEKITYVVLALLTFRLGSYIAVPGVDATEVARLLSAPNNLFGLFNTFSGGALSRLSLFTMGIMPYISASIITQLLTAVYPHFEQLKKEGENGRRKLSFYTRLLTLLIGVFQSLGIVKFLSQSAVVSFDYATLFVIVLSFVTGTMVLMWLGEQLNEKGLGNGSSLLIFTGIVAGLPTTFGHSLENIRQGILSIPTFMLSIMFLISAVYFVVFVERATRKIPVHYARRVQSFGSGATTQQQRSDLPLKINMAGVMPPILASSLLLFPSTISQFFGLGSENFFLIFLRDNFTAGKPLFMLVFTLAIIFFSFFYTAFFFNPKEIAENLKKSGGVIQGIRPGNSTAEYINTIMTRLTLVGSLYIAMVSVVPELLNFFGIVPFSFGGTSLLIVAVVVMDFFTQIQTHLFSAQYENVLKRYQPYKSKT